MKQPQCKNCEKRYVGCHSECEDYKSWKSEHDELIKKASINKEIYQWLGQRSMAREKQKK